VIVQNFVAGCDSTFVVLSSTTGRYLLLHLVTSLFIEYFYPDGAEM
jgi:hypothetical protein